MKRVILALLFVLILSTSAFAGEKFYLGSRVNDNIAAPHMIYSGMPSDVSFSMTFITGYRGYNMYYPTNLDTFMFRDVTYKVIKITPTYIELEVSD